MAKILIVEDSETDETLLLSFIGGSHVCHTVDSGRGALALIQKAAEDSEPYELALIDVLLPDIGGLEVLASLRSLEKDSGISQPAKAILVSGVSDPQVVAKAKELGVDAYLKKPLHRDLLVKEFSTLGIATS